MALDFSGNRSIDFGAAGSIFGRTLSSSETVVREASILALDSAVARRAYGTKDLLDAVETQLEDLGHMPPAWGQATGRRIAAAWDGVFNDVPALVGPVVEEALTGTSAPGDATAVLKRNPQAQYGRWEGTENTGVYIRSQFGDQDPERDTRQFRALGETLAAGRLGVAGVECLPSRLDHALEPAAVVAYPADNPDPWQATSGTHARRMLDAGTYDVSVPFKFRYMRDDGHVTDWTTQVHTITMTKKLVIDFLGETGVYPVRRLGNVLVKHPRVVGPALPGDSGGPEQLGSDMLLTKDGVRFRVAVKQWAAAQREALRAGEEPSNVPQLTDILAGVTENTIASVLLAELPDAYGRRLAIIAASPPSGRWIGVVIESEVLGIKFTHCSVSRLAFDQTVYPGDWYPYVLWEDSKFTGNYEINLATFRQRQSMFKSFCEDLDLWTPPEYLGEPRKTAGRYDAFYPVHHQTWMLSEGVLNVEDLQVAESVLAAGKSEFESMVSDLGIELSPGEDEDST